MIPEVSESMKEVFEVEYPVAECTAAIGFFLVLMLEQLVTRNKLSMNNFQVFRWFEFSAIEVRNAALIL